MQLALSKGFVRNSELSDEFGVSIVTIRQDIDHLAKRGLLQKTYGGGVALGKSAPDSPFEDRASLHADKKRRIGEFAARLIGAGETVILDAGTTTIEIARRIPENADITVVTCAINVAIEAAKRSGVHVVLCGGMLNMRTLSVSGPYIDKVLREIQAHRLFLATYAVNLEKGLGERNIAAAHVKRELIAASQNVIVVCDSSKLGAVAPIMISPVKVANRFITDSDAPPAFLEELRQLGIHVDAV